jgi:hypothetical protein
LLGPGSYEVYANQSPRSTTNDVVKASHHRLFDSYYLHFFRFNQHFRQNIPKYIRKSLPPSIPDPKSSYGFEEDDNGNLVAHEPPSADPDFSNAPVTVCDFVFIY